MDEKPKKKRNRVYEHHPDKEVFQAAVREHIAQHGCNNWELLFKDWGHIGLSNRWVYIKEVKDEEPTPELLRRSDDVLKKYMAGSRTDREDEARLAGVNHIARRLPAAPSPAWMTRAGEAALQNLDFVQEVKTLYQDALKMREASVKDVKQGGEVVGEKVTNPALFDKSIMRRLSILESSLRTMQQVWDLRMIQQFYALIIEEIAKESPEAQARILERLEVLNSRNGMAMGMMV